MKEDTLNIITAEQQMTDLIQESIRHNIYFGLLVALVIGALVYLVYMVKSKDKQLGELMDKFNSAIDEKNKEVLQIQEKHNLHTMEMQKETLHAINIQTNMNANIERLVSGILDKVEKGFDKLEQRIQKVDEQIK